MYGCSGSSFKARKQAVPVFFLSGLLSTPRLMSGRHSLLGSRAFLHDDDAEFPPEIRCESLGPSLPSNESMARFWDKVALTDDEDQAVQALQLIYGSDVQRVTMIGDDRRSRYGRRAVVKIKGQPQPVPLKSLGDGAVRLFGVALALANSQGGFLVIDEAENGIHHSVQRDFLEDGPEDSAREQRTGTRDDTWLGLRSRFRPSGNGFR